jgi:hypothetical protein
MMEFTETVGVADVLTDPGYIFFLFLFPYLSAGLL